MRKKAFGVVSVCITVILVALFLNYSQDSWSVFALDGYGDDIVSVEVHQWNGTAYELKANFTSTGQSVRIVDSFKLKFVVQIKFNSTFAVDTAEAIAFTNVTMNITKTTTGDVWNNAILNNTACTLVGDFYFLKEEGVWNESGKPEAGITYSCSVRYEAYY